MSLINTDNSINFSVVYDMDNVTSLWRRTFLQFISLDLVILQEWKCLLSKGCIRGNGTKKLNPYQITIDQIANLNNNNNNNNANVSIDQKVSKDASKSTTDDKISKNTAKSNTDNSNSNVNSNNLEPFKRYFIALNIQRFLSFFLIDARKIYELKLLSSNNLDFESSSLTGTQDKLDIQTTSYYADIENKQIIDKLQSVNEGLPIPPEYEEIFMTIVESIGDLSNQNDETYVGDETSSSTLADIQGRANDLEEILVQQLFEENPNLSSDPVDICGMRNVFDTFEKMLPDDSGIYMITSSIFSNLLDLWKGLFDSPNPDVISNLVDIIPNIENRFRTATTNSTKQADLWGGSMRLVSDFLSRSATTIRIKELGILQERPLAVQCLVTFRSLSAIDQLILTSNNSSLAVNFYNMTMIDKSGRINWLYVIYWALSNNKELGALFRYALTVEKNKRKYDIPEHYDKDDKNRPVIIPAAMFPGTYDIGASLTAGAGLVLTTEYENESKDDATVFKTLKRPGGRQQALKSEGGRNWYP